MGVACEGQREEATLADADSRKFDRPYARGVRRPNKPCDCHVRWLAYSFRAMANSELAAIFSQIADLLDIQGEDSFRVNAYRRAGRAIEDLTQDVRELAANGELANVPGIGKATREKIDQYLATGKIELHQELLRSLPAELPALLDIPGLGPKKVGLLHKELGITSMADLKEAIAAGKLARVKGFGVKSIEQILHGMEFVQRATGRTPLGLALPIGLELAQAVTQIPSVSQVDIAGSLRRGAETIGDLDLVCESPNGAAVVKEFTALPNVVSVVGAGDTKGSVVVKRRDGFDIRAQLRVVPEESYGAALLYFTGSKEHNIRLRELAGKKGWKLNEWGLFDGEKRLAGKTEEEIYKKLGLPWFPPETREDRGEIEAGMDMPALIERRDIRGDLHTHTHESDGTMSAEDMARAAKAMGYEYIAVTDHSRSSVIANGLTLDRMWRQIERIRRLDGLLDGITVLVGCECDILADGKLDYPDSVLTACDLVVASVHAGLRGDVKKNTVRTIRAMENPFVTIIGHPTGRRLGQREEMELDMGEIIKAAAQTGTALELNSSWQRLDLNDRYVRMARDAGVMIAIDTDAHAAAQMEQIELGIRIARRGWLRKEDVLNTRRLAGLKAWIARKRKLAVEEP